MSSRLPSLKFQTKIAIAIFVAAIASLVLTSSLIFTYLSCKLDDEFQSRLQMLDRTISGTVILMDRSTDAMLTNAAMYIRALALDHKNIDLTYLRKLRNDVAVSHIYIANRQGSYLASTNEPLADLPNLFDYNPDFSSLLHDDRIIISSLVPSLQVNESFKFITFSSQDRRYIYELSLSAENMITTLFPFFATYHDLISIELSTPNQTRLAYVEKPGLSTEEKNSSDLFIHTAKTSSLHSHSLESNRYLVRGDGNYYYRLRIVSSNFHLKEKLRAALLFLTVVCAVAAALAWLLSKFLAAYLVRKISLLNKRVDDVLHSIGLIKDAADDTHGDELEGMTHNFDLMIDNLVARQKEQIDSERLKALAELSSQVAHDLRSPLIAMKMLVQTTDPLPEQQRVLLGAIVGRISEVADSLLSEYRSTRQTLPGDVKSQTTSLAGIAESIVAEKKLLLLDQRRLQIELLPSGICIGPYVAMEASMLKRIMSNIVDNAIEAIGQENGSISISIGCDASNTQLVISDNGPGIAAEDLALIGSIQHSKGKENGNGLGLLNARRTLEMSGGFLSIDSTPNQGTSVTIVLPRISTPPCIVTSVEVSPTICILDDEQDMHLLWRDRFAETHPDSHLYQLLHFSTYTEFTQWLSDNKRRNFTLLSDHNIGIPDLNGADIICTLRLQGRAYLVTNHFDNQELLDRCERESIRLLPKAICQTAPISIKRELQGPSSGPDLVLIDDEMLIRECWKIAASRENINLRTFSSIAEFEAQREQIPISTPLFIDCELGHDSIRGDIYAETLSSYGFKSIFLASGYTKFDLRHTRFSVVSKEFPRNVLL